MSYTVNPVALPDFGATWQRGQMVQDQRAQNALAMAAAQRQMEQEDNYNNLLQKPGVAEGITSTDPTQRGNALASLFRYGGPRGAQQALPMMTQDRQEAQLNGPAQPAAAAPPTLPAAAPAPAGAASPPPEMVAHFIAASRETGIPVPVLMAVAKQESDFGRVPSRPGDGQGVMQVLNSTARNPGFGMAGTDPATLTDPGENIRFGARYLRARNPNVDFSDPRQIGAALRNYNGGGDPNYAQNVSRHLPQGGGAPATQPPSAPNGLPAVPGFDMAKVARAQQFAATNPMAAAYWQNYLQTAQLLRKEDATTTAAPGSAILRNGQVIGTVPNAPVTEETRIIDGRAVPGQVGADGKFTPYPDNAPQGYVRRDGRLVPEEGGPAASDARAREFSNTRQLREEFNSSQAAKDYSIVRPNYQAIQRAANTDTRAADIDMVFAFAKMLDPNSVVREGEQITLMRTGGVFDAVAGYISGLSGGGRLTPEVRAAIKAQADSRFGIAADAHDERLDYYSGLARENGFNPGSIGRTSDRAPARAGTTPPPAPAPAGPPAPGTVQDGYRFRGGNPADPASWEPVR